MCEERVEPNTVLCRNVLTQPVLWPIREIERLIGLTLSATDLVLLFLAMGLKRS